MKVLATLVARVRREVKVLQLAYRDPRTPWYARGFIAAVIAYAASPIDLIPDFIPIIGHVDDVVIVPVGLWLARRLTPAAVIADCRAAAEDLDPATARAHATGTTSRATRDT